jgi:ribosomal protein S18 acetylase RimI-like enzyme
MITLRPATPGELDLIVTMMGEYYAYDNLVFEESIARRAAREMINDPSLGTIFVIQRNDTPCGYCVLALIFSLEFHGRTAFIDELYLREEARGHGSGRRVLELVMDECRVRGMDAVRLEVEHTNLRAVGVYGHLGFVRHERHIMTRWLGN